MEVELPPDINNLISTKTAHLSCIEDTLSLESDPTADELLNKMTLVGRICAEKILNKNAVKNILARAWHPCEGLVIDELGLNTFQFTFSQEKHCTRVVEQGPWSVMGHHMVLKKWLPQGLVLGELDFHLTTFWVQVNGLPPNQISEKNAKAIGDKVGKTIDIDVMRPNRMRLKVEFDVNKPLKTGFVWERNGSNNLPPVWVQFKYERLSDFCYRCGRISHTENSCNFEPPPPMVAAGCEYGGWLRAEPLLARKEPKPRQEAPPNRPSNPNPTTSTSTSTTQQKQKTYIAPHKRPSPTTHLKNPIITGQGLQNNNNKLPKTLTLENQMGRRNFNDSKKKEDKNHNLNNLEAEAAAMDTTFEDETIEETIESSNLEEPMSEFVDSVAAPGGDQTSADYYFDSYSHFGIHEEMLKDVVRTKTYQNVIYQNKFMFKDKVVLDVGAGTGILSLFCAKAGARHVYAVECSQMADMAKEIVETNGFSNVITVMKGKIEEIALPVAQVDIIISEWMGYFLLFENMLNTVLYARDKWLVNDGIVLPDKAALYLTAIEDAEYKQDKIEFWNNVYGFDMSCIKKQAQMEPLVDTVDQNQIVTNCQLLKTMDISKMDAGDASFTVPFKLVAQRNDYIHALVAYFDVSFTKCHKLMGFSTGPRSRSTHWKQTVLYLEDVLTICEGEELAGSMTVAPNKKNPRDIDIMLKYSLKGQRCTASRTQYHKMR